MPQNRYIRLPKQRLTLTGSAAVFCLSTEAAHVLFMMTAPNQNPEQIARDNIDARLHEAGWLVQAKKAINLSAGAGVAVREYHTNAGTADYILFVNRQPVGVIEAKREEEAVRLSSHEDQTEAYVTLNLKMQRLPPIKSWKT